MKGKIRIEVKGHASDSSGSWFTGNGINSDVYTFDECTRLSLDKFCPFQSLRLIDVDGRIPVLKDQKIIKNLWNIAKSAS